MSDMARWTLDDPTTMAIRLALLVTAVIGVAWILDRLLARRPAAARHAVWLCAMIIILSGPAIAAIMGRAGISLATIRWAPASSAVAGRAANTEGPAASRPPAPSSPAGASTGSDAPAPAASGTRLTDGRAEAPAPRQPSPRVEPGPPGRPDRPAIVTRQAIAGALLAAWLIGVLVLGARLIRGMVVLGSLRRSARPIEAGELGRIPDQVRAALEIGELPRILVSPRIAGPVALGIARPAVVLPEGWPGTIGEGALRDVLIHECAHIARRDPLVGLLQRLVELTYWPHPLVHVLNRRLSRTREEACDDVVLSRGDAIAYARTLLALAHRHEAVRRPREALTLLGASWRLEHRIAGILDPARRITDRAPRGVLLGAGAILLIAGVTVAGVRWEGSGASDQTPSAETKAATEPIPQGRPIRGIVIDEAGKPVAGASVRLVRDWKAPEGAVTGADGTFVIRDRSPLMLLAEELIAVGDGGRRQGLGVFHQPPNNRVPTAPARIVLKPSRAVSVVVRDAAGKPVPGASVEIIGDYSSVATGRTDGDGKVVLRYPDGPNVEWIVALKAGGGFDYFENYRSWPSEGSPTVPPSVSLVLNGARPARLKAVDSKGNPVAGVEFVAWLVKKRGKLAEANIAGSRIARARSDRDGIAAFEWLPADAEQAVPFLLLPCDFHAPERPVITADFPPAPKAVRLDRKVILRGKVIGPDGRPTPGILVEAAGTGKTFADEYEGHMTRTDENGAYSIATAMDHSYMITVNDPSWTARTRTGIVLRREGEPRDVADLKLIKGTLLRGRVTVGPDKSPLAGSWVVLTQKGDPLPGDYKASGRGVESLNRHVETDAEGRYAFRIAAGEYTLLRPDHKGDVAISVESQDEIVHDFHVESTAGVRYRHLRGLVRDVSNAKRTPVADALLTAFGPSGRDVDGRADADGRFDLSVFYDPSFLYARNPEGTRAGSVPIKPGEGLALVHIGPASRVTGRITDRAGEPLPGWRVWLAMQVRAESGSPIQFHRETVTDERGSYTFAGLIVGTRCDISAPPRPEPWDGSGPIMRRDFTVSSSDPVELRDMVPGGP